MWKSLSSVLVILGFLIVFGPLVSFVIFLAIGTMSWVARVNPLACHYASLRWDHADAVAGSGADVS
jgi:hypothetical protein